MNRYKNQGAIIPRVIWYIYITTLTTVVMKTNKGKMDLLAMQKLRKQINMSSGKKKWKCGLPLIKANHVICNILIRKRVFPELFVIIEKPMKLS